MKSPLPHRGTGAFTLVELLTVIAILGILAALLLPVLQKGKDRARLAGCESNLGQLGVAFHSFAHDHGSKFPMQVSLTQGGAQEFVQNGYLVNGEFYFAYRVFQSLEDELVTPKILICPTDTRVPATNFISLRNSNVSYFVGVGADYFQPESVLAGDRNLRAGAGRSIYPAAGQLVRWSETLHQNKGNLLFADGHVEESRGFLSAGGAGGAGAQNDFFIPSEKAEAAPAAPASVASQNVFHQASAANTNRPAPGQATGTNPPALPVPAVVRSQNGAGSAAATGPAVPVFAQPPTSDVAPVPIVTNAPAAVDDDAVMSPLSRRLALVLRFVIGWSYLLLLLIFLLWLWFKVRQARRQRRDEP